MNIMKKLSFIVIGIVAIVCAIICISSDTGSYEAAEFYGGDAYTGIQQAAAQTANNVRTLTELVSFGFAAILGVTGLICIAYGLFCRDYKKILTEISSKPGLQGVHAGINTGFVPQPPFNTPYAQHPTEPYSPAAMQSAPDATAPDTSNFPSAL